MQIDALATLTSGTQRGPNPKQIQMQFGSKDCKINQKKSRNINARGLRTKTGCSGASIQID